MIKSENQGKPLIEKSLGLIALRGNGVVMLARVRHWYSGTRLGKRWVDVSKKNNYKQKEFHLVLPSVGGMLCETPLTF